jgi:hypothetical protein
MEAAKYFGALILGDEDYAPVSNDIIGIFGEYLDEVDQSSSVTDCVDALYAYLSIPSFIANQRTGAILHDLKLIEEYAYAHLYPSHAFFDKLSSDKYLVFETIGAEVYAWLDGSDAYLRFNWKPISVDYDDFDWADLITGQDDWGPVLTAIKTSEVNPANDAAMIDYIENAKRWNAIYLTYLAYAHGHQVYGSPLYDAAAVYGSIGTHPSYQGDYSSTDSYDNLRLARFLSGSANGTCIVKDITNNDMFTLCILQLFETMTSGEYYSAYYYSSAMNRGKYEVITDSKLASMATYVIVGVAAVVAGFFALKAIAALKVKAFTLKAKAEAGAWTLSMYGVGTKADYAKFYKMSRKANRLTIIASALTGSISTLSTLGSSSSALLNSNGILNVGDSIKGGKSVNDVYALIK